MRTKKTGITDRVQVHLQLLFPYFLTDFYGTNLKRKWNLCNLDFKANNLFFQPLSLVQESNQITPVCIREVRLGPISSLGSWSLVPEHPSNQFFAVFEQKLVQLVFGERHDALQTQ